MGLAHLPASPAVAAADDSVRIRLITPATIRGVAHKADDELSVDSHVADSLVGHFRVAVRVDSNG